MLVQRKEVRSVVLVTRSDDLVSVQSVALDESSRTSATLVKIIFQEFLETEPTWETAIPDLRQMLAENDGALIIGDPGMTFSRDGYHVWDLASLARIHRAGIRIRNVDDSRQRSETARCLDFAKARDEGVAKIAEIVDYYQQRLSLSRAEILEYLTKNISFAPDEMMQQGLRLYFELACKHGLIDKVKPLRYSTLEMRAR